MKRLKITKEEVHTKVTYEVDKYCCKEMEHALTLLDSTEYAYGSTSFKWREGKLLVSIYESNSCSDDDRDIDKDDKQVKYCPFCGKKVE